MKKYFRYLIETKWLQTVIIAGITAILFMIILAIFSNDFLRNNFPLNYPGVFGVSGILLFVVSIIVVFFRFSALRNQKEVDLYYGLPMSRKDLYATQYLFGLVQILFISFVVFLFGFIELIALSSAGYYEAFFLLYYLMTVVYLVIVYTLTTFVFIKANTIVDGIIFVILVNILLLFVSLFIMRLNQYMLMDRIAFVVSPYYSQSILARILFTQATPNATDVVLEPFEWIFILINSLVYTVLSWGAIIYVKKTIGTEKVEHIGDISNNLFGYVGMIPLIIFFGVVGTDFMGTISIFFKSMFLIAGFMGLFVYRRGVKITLKDSALVIIPWVLGIIFSVIIH
ncbi:MAG: hypothetical protein C4537_00980 [Acholeplasma sp.]|jgi:hypothetical protein|nr:MAG: hypothetical protein C4537_00980 [Acholeplasma sp.]